MCLLLETIKLENGRFANLPFHNRRFNKARRELFNLPEQDLAEIIKIPEANQTGIFRCRVLYGEQINQIEFIPHQNRQINSMQAVRDDLINYTYKYADRTRLQLLFDQRKDADEIIIIKNGLVTDCFIGNLVFFNGQSWFTPDQPLLQGTQREKLLAEAKIKAVRITEEMLFTFEEIGVINVFYDLENMPRLKASQIKSPGQSK